MLNVFKDFF